MDNPHHAYREFVGHSGTTDLSARNRDRRCVDAEHPSPLKASVGNRTQPPFAAARSFDREPAGKERSALAIIDQTICSALTRPRPRSQVHVEQISKKIE
jgi:hypothetical protein